MNGEHEYRESKWRKAFKDAGLKINIEIPLKRTAEDLMTSIYRLLTLDRTGRRNRGTPVYEIKKWIKQKLKGELFSPEYWTCFIVEKI